MPDTVLIEVAPGAALTAVVVTLLMAGFAAVLWGWSARTERAVVRSTASEALFAGFGDAVARSEAREAKARDGKQKPQVA